MPLDGAGLRRAFSEFASRFEIREPVFYATYVSDNEDGTHEVDMHNPDGSTGPRRTVYGKVMAWPGVIVRIGIDRLRWGPTEYVILGADEMAYAGTGAPSILEGHGENHGDQAPDQIPNLHTLQLWPLRVQPSSGLTVDVLGGLYYADGQYHTLSLTNVNLTAYVPATAGQRVYVTLSLDGDGNVTATAGTTKSAPTAEDIAPAPLGERPLCAVLLANGDTTISQNAVRSDLRHLPGLANTGYGGGTLLGSATVDLQNGDSKTTVFTVPTGRSAIVTHVIVHSPSGSLAGGTDFDIGSGANADTWRQTLDLSSMTATDDYMVIPSIAATPVKYTLEAAGAEFGIKPITGATADVTATMVVFGLLI